MKGYIVYSSNMKVVSQMAERAYASVMKTDGT